MSLMSFSHGLLRQVVAMLLMVSIGLASLASAWAQQATPAPGAGGGITWRVCNPGVCMSKADKIKYAQDHNCRFPEDVCEGKTTAETDNQGAVGNDQSIWGSLWNQVKGSVVYGYEFVKGLYAGLKDQISDVINLITNAGEVISGLIELGKAFFNDPQGTLASLAEMLGQEAVDTITRATQCGAYDLGKVVGTYVSPAFALKLATRLNRFGGNLADASKSLKRDYGCASFGAGTEILTTDGLRPIETLDIGQQVYARHEGSFADKPQAITNAFGRIAPSYRELYTEQGSFKITDEHPVWVQGKGWTLAEDVRPMDIIAAEQGDLLVTANEAVKRPLPVYNFSVANTPNYFVGPAGMWVHNADGDACDLSMLTTNWKLLTPKARGFRAEYQIFQEMAQKGFEPVGSSFNPKGKSPGEAFKDWDGQTGIDGLYYNKNTGEYLVVESKATGSEKRSDPCNTTGAMCRMNTPDKERQMSDMWIRDRLDKLGLTPTQKAEIEAGLRDKSTGKVTKVFVLTDEKQTRYRRINELSDTDVRVGGNWP